MPDPRVTSHAVVRSYRIFGSQKASEAKMQRRAPREMGYRGRQVLSFVRQAIERDGHAPSYTMIRDALGFSDRGDVGKVVKRLEQRGLLSRVGNGRVRRIRVVG